MSDATYIRALAWAVEQAAAWEGAHTGGPNHADFLLKLKEADLALVKIRRDRRISTLAPMPPVIGTCNSCYWKDERDGDRIYCRNLHLTAARDWYCADWKVNGPREDGPLP